MIIPLTDLNHPLKNLHALIQIGAAIGERAVKRVGCCGGDGEADEGELEGEAVGIAEGRKRLAGEGGEVGGEVRSR